MDEIDLEKLSFWAKTTKEGEPGIDVRQHMQNVAAVVRQIANHYQYLMRGWGLDISEAALLAGLHDIGKISPQFQRKCNAWLLANGLSETDGRCGWQNYAPYHAMVSQFTLERLLKDNGFTQQAAVLWAATIGAHHGRLLYMGERGLKPQPGMQADSWEQIRRATATRFAGNFSLLSRMRISPEDPLLWWVAGLTTIADWIASDEHHFPVEGTLSPEQTEAKAGESLAAIGWAPPVMKSNLDFSEAFFFRPNALQTAAARLIDQPGLYIVEAPMGMGKTEAALYAAYKLIEKRMACGIYFALPTQVTSNRIYLRLQEFAAKVCREPGNVMLIHANSWLVDGKIPTPDLAETPEDTQEEKTAKYNWFSSSKRALLSSFGVGTIDQALMGVIAVKHFFVRQFALAGKVVILDEVHSYDMYTGTLINQLCRRLVKLGATVLILSATLTAERRRELLQTAADIPATPIRSYPLLSGCRQTGRYCQEGDITPPADKKIRIAFRQEQEAIFQAWEHVRTGAVLLWICDTVAKAQTVYRAFKQRAGGSDIAVGLLHSRFPFFRREEIETQWLEKLGKNNRQRGACVLVSTQIVEQSVDIDADLIVSELAPTDMLLQRIGRLWRHPRADRPVHKPWLWLIEESFKLEETAGFTAVDLKSALGSKAYVYDPYVLLRSLQECKKRETIAVPSEIREILEATYKDAADEPSSWQELKSMLEDKKAALAKKALLGTNFWSLPALKDEEGVMTRINSQPVVGIVLGLECRTDAVVLLDGSLIPLKESKTASKNMPVARAINRNLVKVPEYVFGSDDFKITYLSKYVQGKVMLCVPDSAGFLNIDQLKEKYKLKWSLTEGLEIIRLEGEEDETNE